MKHLLHNTPVASKHFVLAAVLSCASFMAAAQSENTVTIKFDDGDGITGELLDFSNNMLRLNTSIGPITIPADGVSCIGSACPESLRLEVATAPVVLTSLDGSTTLNGDLIEVSNGQYVVATIAGELRIDVDVVTCEGEGCVVPASTPTFGGPVVLTSGITEIEGKLLGIDDDSYLVEVDNLGEIRVQLDLFSCSGEGCPPN